MSNSESSLNIICLETEAFYRLIETVVDRLQDDSSKGDKWIDDSEAMNLLRIKSKTTLQKLRDEGAIRFSQPMKKVILYDRESIMQFLEKNAKNTFQ